MAIALEYVREIYHRPLLQLVFEAQAVHRQHHPPNRVQLCALVNIKSGGCPEDCAYCPQSARYSTGIETYPLISLDSLREQAMAAQKAGATRLCMGAAWRSAPEGEVFERVLEMVRTVRELGMEACVTLGMVSAAQAQQLATAGLTAYNHNLDTSPEFYPRIITTRTYQDRLETLAHVGAAGLQICCGGIVGLGETDEDRIALLHVLANLTPPPTSVPINALVPVAGTPLGQLPPPDPLLLVRTIATARLLLPRAQIRLSAGRKNLSESDQALCFSAGANSIFTGEKLLTTPNPGSAADAALLEKLGLQPL
ncbi:biotin synthase BioB [Synechococcus sp. H55.7]|uniref:biotin synthase BioB n=1 Tax=unclassified Synechococcus TaxID=2626047 RepID=UPI0039C1B737